MTYNEEIEQRINAFVNTWPDCTVKKTFGGVCYLLSGNMACGVYREDLILRLGTAKARQALKLPYVRSFDITGRPLKGWVMVKEEGFDQVGGLDVWLEQARAFVSTLPPK